MVSFRSAKPPFSRIRRVFVFLEDRLHISFITFWLVEIKISQLYCKIGFFHASGKFYFPASQTIFLLLTKLNYTLSHSPLRQKRLIYEWSTIGSMIQEEQCPTWINKKDKRRDDNRGNKQRQFQSANRTLLFAPSSSVYLAWFFLSPSLFCLDPFPLSLTARRRRKQLGTGSRAENIDVP